MMCIIKLCMINVSKFLILELDLSSGELGFGRTQARLVKELNVLISGFNNNLLS